MVRKMSEYQSLPSAHLAAFELHNLFSCHFDSPEFCGPQQFSWILDGSINSV